MEAEERESAGDVLSCMARKRASLGMASLPEIRYTQRLPLYASALEVVRHTVRERGGKPPHSKKWGYNFSAAITRGMPARSLVTPTFVHAGEPSSRRTGSSALQ